ncbi:MAG: hypothetical protein EXR95_10955 [Gemmatimonadetes bacterium]|nr:hypothetical protein [Gemmatimonadota bacterium]
MLRRPRTLLAALIALAACSDPGAPSVDDASSFAQLQRHLFDRQCVSCHAANGSAFAQSGLSLLGGVSYEQLVGAQPRNEAARTEGLLLVKPGAPNASLLLHKLQWNPTHHVGHAYGSPMPLGGAPPGAGQIEFVSRWIAAGAPREGVVADSALLLDLKPAYVETFQPLAPPAQGFQLHIDPFQVAPSFEREIFVYRRVGNTTDVYVNRIETKMRANSHHLLVQTFKAATPAPLMPTFDQVRDIRNLDGTLVLQNLLPMGYHVFFSGAGTPAEDHVFPTGVALKLPANAALDLNTHFVNRGTQPIIGEAYINLHTVDASRVQRVASTLELGNQEFALPPGVRTVVTKTFTFSTTTTIFMLTAHFHEHGEKFVIRIARGPRDGEAIYTSTDWADPVISWFAQPLVLQAGQGLTSEVTYDNKTNRTLTFGLTSQDEMDIIFGYTY